MSKKNNGLSRRQLLQGLGAAGLLGAAGFGLSQWKSAPPAVAQPGQGKDPKFLIVLAASGGASLVDSFLAIRESESANAPTLNCFPDKLVKSVEGSPFRAVDQRLDAIGPIPMPSTTNQSEFVKKHKQDMMVVTQTGSSVNHEVAQRRCVTGNEIWAGRTLQECVAAEYGESYALPNVLLASGTQFIQHGTDTGLPTYALGEKVANPSLWPLGLHGTKGLTDIDPSLIQQMRLLRDESLDPHTRFTKLYQNNKALQRWTRTRGESLRNLEAQDLISKLMLYPDSAKYPLKKSGLAPSPSAQLVREKFPNLEVDPLETQAALAFLLLKFRVSVAVTIAPNFDVTAVGDHDIYGNLTGGGKKLPEGTVLNTPIAFDFSHQAHRATQAFMWNRVLGVADRLIDLLKSEEYASGESFWDRTLIYVATEFGRVKNRPANAPDFGTAHSLNNGFLVLSPLANGNTLLGGVDPDTAMTYGWDTTTGKADKGRNAEEKEIFAGVLQALGVDTSPANLPDVRAMRKKA
ncbi:MAG: hypothetical protein EP343_31440 [Deltaproteobacteria bacterium]|nr:MAG: hypothetical protein EP343_31440 [Deltaproteobacteria bacterium]